MRELWVCKPRRNKVLRGIRQQTGPGLSELWTRSQTNREILWRMRRGAHRESSRFHVSSSPSPTPPPESPISNPQAQAEACCYKALEIARKQQARFLELCAATSLARLWREQGKRDKAHAVLSEVYNWFTEGFDTKDLQEAKAPLEELKH